MASNKHSKKRARFFPVLHHVANSFAWARLSPTARAAYVEIGLLYNGSNNGMIAMSSRQLGERLNVSHHTAWRAVNQLITFGFLERSRASSFAQKREAAEYRFTHMKCDRTGDLPKNSYERIVLEKAPEQDERSHLRLVS